MLHTTPTIPPPITTHYYHKSLSASILHSTCILHLYFPEFFKKLYSSCPPHPIRHKSSGTFYFLFVYTTKQNNISFISKQYPNWNIILYECIGKCVHIHRSMTKNMQAPIMAVAASNFLPLLFTDSVLVKDFIWSYLTDQIEPIN